MSGQWCRFCGGFGLTDRMVCHADSCQASDLRQELLGIVDGDPEFSLSSGAITGSSDTYSLHAYARALDIADHTITVTDITDA